MAGWRWAFLLNVPICVLLLFLIWRHVDESRDPEAAGFDVPGILTFSSALFFLTWALIEVNNSAWDSLPVLWRAGTATVLLTGFMLLESRQMHPMIDPGLFRFPAFVGAAAAMAGYAAAGQMLIFYLPLYLQNRFGLTPVRAGVAMLPFAFPMFLAPRLRSRLPDSSRKVLFLGMTATCFGDLLLAAGDRQSSYLAFAVGMAVAGSGAGILNGETAKVLQGSVPAERGGMAAGLSATIRFTALLTSVAGLGAVLSGVTTRVFALDTALSCKIQRDCAASCTQSGTRGILNFSEQPD
jgi:predicted MFS family arabinose efflux permease